MLRGDQIPDLGVGAETRGVETALYQAASCFLFVLFGRIFWSFPWEGGTPFSSPGGKGVQSSKLVGMLGTCHYLSPGGGGAEDFFGGRHSNLLGT